MANWEGPALKRHDKRTIIHFDYDCFYAAVFEREDPKLRFLPLAVQQKQIIVTCNYEARRRGLHKLQLVKEARKMCPEVIVMLGEDLTRFRDASKDNYDFLRNYSWSKKVERLGFDEVFMDVSDMIDYNVDLLNFNHLAASFFNLDRHDPTVGFDFDATEYYGHIYPETLPHFSGPSPASISPGSRDSYSLSMRLRLGSHLSRYLRNRLEEQKGYTCTVGVSTNKLLSKLVGNLHKPKGQTTLVPPYVTMSENEDSNVNQFIDGHDIGKVPGVGFKTAQKIRGFLLGRAAAFDTGLVYGPTKENITVSAVRRHPNVSLQSLERLLGGARAPKGIGAVIWGLLQGIDESEVAKARDVPQQISIEDSYLRLDTMEELKKELTMLARSLIKRMRLDLTSDINDDDIGLLNGDEEQLSKNDAEIPRRWIAYPRTLRLTTRPRLPLNPDGTRSRTFNRISRSCNMPSTIFSLANDVDVLAAQLVTDTLISVFRKLHPERSGWNLSLVNLCATNMTLVANDSRDGVGRSIEKMFKKQEDSLKEWKVEDVDIAPSGNDFGIQQQPPTSVNNEVLTANLQAGDYYGSEDVRDSTQQINDNDNTWNSEDDALDPGVACHICDAVMPPFAMAAHERFHAMPD